MGLAKTAGKCLSSSEEERFVADEKVGGSNPFWGTAVSACTRKVTGTCCFKGIPLGYRARGSGFRKARAS